ncbi:MAG: hypothetical protein ACJAV1_003692 [Paraglaciecola sp.]|jgi:hypothetical protein
MKTYQNLLKSALIAAFSLTLLACGSSSEIATPAEALVSPAPAPSPQPTSPSDQEPPVIELMGESPYSLALGQPFEDPGAKAIDDVDGEVPVTVNKPTLSNIGTYAVVYSAKDSAGNESSVERTVIVNDVVAPVISLNGPQSITLEFGKSYDEQGATATDDVDGNVEVTIDGSIGEGIGSYTIIYSAVDKAGNQSSTNRTVVVEDLVGPVITLNGAVSMNLEFGKPYDEQGASATDDVDGQVEVTVEGSVGEAIGIYMVSYLATDKAGNESIIERRVKVEQFVFEGDIARDISQSTPTDMNIPLGIKATMDIDYLGAFRPITAWGRGSNSATGILGYNSDNNSLFMAGHERDASIAEFEIPSELSKETNPADILQAMVLQDYFPVLEKREAGNQTDRITGILYVDGNLIVNSEIWYDGSGSNKDNMQVFSNANDLRSSSYVGMLQLDGSANAAGYMSEVPDNLKADLNSDYIVGWASNSAIASRYSQGPSMFTFDPKEALEAVVTVDKVISSEAKMVFPYGTAEIAPHSNGETMDVSPIWSAKARGFYGFLIPNTRYFMVVGSQGGIHSGIGYKITQNEGAGETCGGYCSYDSSDNYNFFWIFNIDDILKSENPWNAQPISYGKWSHPYDNGGVHKVRGGAFDSSTNVLYLTLAGAGKVGLYDNPPLILSYKITAK